MIIVPYANGRGNIAWAEKSRLLGWKTILLRLGVGVWGPKPVLSLITLYSTYIQCNHGLFNHGCLLILELSLIRPSLFKLYHGGTTNLSPDATPIPGVAPMILRLWLGGISWTSGEMGSIIFFGTRAPSVLHSSQHRQR